MSSHKHSSSVRHKHSLSFMKTRQGRHSSYRGCASQRLMSSTVPKHGAKTHYSKKTLGALALMVMIPTATVGVYSVSPQSFNEAFSVARAVERADKNGSSVSTQTLERNLSSSTTSRSYERTSIGGSWSLEGSLNHIDSSQVTDYTQDYKDYTASVSKLQSTFASQSNVVQGSQADTSTLTARDVRAINTYEYAGHENSGYVVNHATGDNGNAYEFSQCTWWAYLRRKQLGYPVSSHMGNGMDWAKSARALGYWVDNTPHVGDVVVFQPNQEGADSTYGHVAIVENVSGDTIVISESGSGLNGKVVTRTIHNASRFDYIHY